MLAHLCGASVKNTKKNSENAMRKPPMDDCGAKKAVSIPEEQIRPCRDRRNAAGQGAQAAIYWPLRILAWRTDFTLLERSFKW